MDAWTRQSLVLAAVVAVAASLAVLLPWSWLRILLLVFAVVAIFMMLRNPLTAWRRLGRLVVLAAIGSLAIGISGAAKGSASFGALGEITYYFELGSSPYWYGLMIFAVLCLIGDIVVTTIEWRRRKVEFSAAEMRIAVRMESDSLTIRHDFSITGPSPGGLVLTGARLCLEGWLSAVVRCELFGVNGQVRLRVTAVKPERIAADETRALTLGVAQAERWFRMRFKRRKQLSLLALFPVRGRLVLETSAGSRGKAEIPVLLDLSD